MTDNSIQESSRPAGRTQVCVPPIDDTDDVMTAALKYAAAELYVLPIDPDSKKPARELGNKWQLKSSRDAEQIVAWFAGTDYGIGLHTGRSGIVAFDVDHPDQVPDVLAKAIEEEGPPHQSTRTEVAGRGHYLFAFRHGRVLGNGVGRLGGAWGEIRGRSGQIVLAPTRHEKADEGGRYAWVSHGPIPELPAYVDELLNDVGDAVRDVATDEQVRAFLGEYTAASRPELLTGWVTTFEKKVASGESRHMRMLSVAAGAFKEARAGYFPARAAMERLEAVFLDAVQRDPVPGGKQGAKRGPGMARSEWLGISAWAVAEANAADLNIVRRKVAKTMPDGNDLSWIKDTGHSGDRKGTSPRPSVDITNEPDAIRALTCLITGSKALPGLYTRDGRLVGVHEQDPGEGTSPGRAVVSEVTEATLRRLLAEHTDCFRIKHVKKDEFVTVAALPAVSTCAAVLSRTDWGSVPPLRSVATTPVLRPDGTVLQERGYDAATGIYLTSGSRVPAVSEHPNREEVAAARELLLDQVLVDFPWVEPADRANYLAVLLTPVLRPYIGGLAPLGAITAPERGAGKSLLADLARYVFGGAMRALPENDDEMRKAITAMLRDTAPVLIFDNVPARSVLKQESLAAVLTMTEWSDRLLGHNRVVNLPNDRLWLATGTNIRLGGDMAQRTTLVRIDPRTPRPDRRGGFVLDPLDQWVRENRGKVLHALLTLARAWITAGAPKDDAVRWRTFTEWSAVMGGLLTHHGVEGFLANRDETDVADEDAEQWTPLLAAWHARYGDKPTRVRDLRADADTAIESGADPGWAEVFPKNARDDRPVSVKTLTGMLRERRGRYYGDHRLDGRYDSHDRTWRWAVTPVDLLATLRGSGDAQ